MDVGVCIGSNLFQSAEGFGEFDDDCDETKDLSVQVPSIGRFSSRPTRQKFDLMGSMTLTRDTHTPLSTRPGAAELCEDPDFLLLLRPGSYTGRVPLVLLLGFVDRII